MGRKINTNQLKEVQQAIQENKGEFRANDVAKHLNLHPQTVARLLPAFGAETETLLYEDDKGFLNIFKK